MPFRSLSRKRLTQLIIGTLIGGTAVGYGGYKGSQKLGLINPPTNVVVNGPGPTGGGGGFALSCTLTAADGNSSTVSTMINTNATPGTSGSPHVYCIPQGTWHWSSHVGLNMPAYTVLLGEGTLPSRGAPTSGGTIIVDDYQVNDSTGLIYFNIASTGTVRIAGITFQGGTGFLKDNATYIFNGSNSSFRLDHNTFQMQTYTAGDPNKETSRFTGWLRGVVDHNKYYPDGIGNGAKLSYDGMTGDTLGVGDAGWADDTNNGGSDWLFFEDNDFNGNTKFGTVNDCKSGGKQVIRYNHIISAGIQTHPTGGSGVRARGCRAMEIYGNQVDSPTYHSSFDNGQKFTVMFLSSGTLLMWNNYASADMSQWPNPAGYQHFLTLHSMRRDNGTYAETATPNGWGYCGTSFNGTGSNWDGNTVTSTGYPCLDQPGRGKGDKLINDVPNVTNQALGCTSSTPCWPRQALEPIYEWLNTKEACTGCDWNDFGISPQTDGFTANTDYYGATSNSSCNQGAGSCTAGVGVGTLAQRPANCTTGVAWWATDQGEWNSTNGATADGKMYICTATNTWTVRYGGSASNTSGTPYTYPHPLTGG